MSETKATQKRKRRLCAYLHIRERAADQTWITTRSHCGKSLRI